MKMLYVNRWAGNWSIAVWRWEHSADPGDSKVSGWAYCSTRRWHHCICASQYQGWR